MSWFEKILPPRRTVSEVSQTSDRSFRDGYDRQTERILSDMKKAVGLEGSTLSQGQEVMDDTGKRSPSAQGDKNEVFDRERPSQGKGIEYYTALERDRQQLTERLETQRKRGITLAQILVLLQGLRSTTGDHLLSQEELTSQYINQKLKETAIGLASYSERNQSSGEMEQALREALAKGKLFEIINRYDALRQRNNKVVVGLEEKLGSSQAEWDEFTRRVQWTQQQGSMDPETARKTAAAMITLTDIRRNSPSQS